MFTIKLNNLKFYAYIGVLPEEKELGQQIEVDIEVQVKGEVKHDQLDESISYVDFFEIARDNVENSRVDLVETLAWSIARQIEALDTDRILGVTVRVRKFSVPIPALLDSAEIVVSLP